MRLSEDRISHIAHIIADGIWNDDMVDFKSDHEVLQEIKRVISNYFKIEDDADERAREKVRSIKRYIPEGSREWDILYKQYFQEETDKRRF